MPDCIHTPNGGLCRACQREYDEDPSAWLEYGDHSAGLLNRAELHAQVARQQAECANVPVDPDLPF